MKRLFVLAIAGIFTVGIALKLAYGWGADANCWEFNGGQYASASASSDGLRNGNLHAFA